MREALESEIGKMLDEWEDNFTTAKERVIRTVALETVKRLQDTSPTMTGDYAKGWTAVNKGGIIIVRNETDWQLTHLLEYGHANPRAITGRKRTPAHPHIAKAERWASEELIRRLEEL